MRTLALVPMIVVSLILPISDLHADGKLYIPRDTPPVGEPYQRAILEFRNGTETLIIQPQFAGATKDFGWIVPVPSLPKMGYVENPDMEDFFHDLARYSSPGVVHVRDIFFSVLLGLGAVGFLIAVGTGFGRLRLFGMETSRLTMRLLACASVLLILIVGWFPSYMSHMSAGISTADVDILASGRIGVYDTHVIRPVERKTGALLDWLKANGFNYSAEDEAIFQSYVEKDWLFVTAKIAFPEEKKASSTPDSDGLLQSLLLRFAAPAPVYPFALSASSEKPTMILLYALCDQRMSHPLLPTEFAGSIPNVSTIVHWGESPKEISFLTLGLFYGHL